MESRKLILFGKNSFVISLPKSWVVGNNLKKGDMVYIEDRSSELAVTPSESTIKEEQKKMIIEIQDKELGRIRSEIISAYLMNNDIIELIGENMPENVKNIKNIIRDLSGLEIMGLTSKRITAQVILNEAEVDLENLFRRVDMIVRSMISDSISTLKEDMYENIQARDTDVNRLVWLSFRVVRKAMKNPRFAKKINMNNIDLLNYKNIVAELEGIGDQAKRVARYVRKLKLNQKSQAEFHKLYSSLNELYLETMKAYYKKDRELAFEVMGISRKKNFEFNLFMEKNANIEVVFSIGFLKSMNSQIKEIARIISAA